MKDLKKSYKGFVIWLVLYMISFFVPIFLPSMSTQLLIAVIDNIMLIGCAILSLIIYITEQIYWYNGTSYEDAVAAGSERRKCFALEHLKRFGIAAVAFLIYSVISILIGIPYGVDITIAIVAILVAAISTIKIKL